VAAYATTEGELLHVRGRVTALDGSQQVDVAVVGPVGTAEALGRDLAALAAAQGAGKLLVEGAQRQPDTWHHAAPVQ
jgi:porphobilinogen deaminase